MNHDQVLLKLHKQYRTRVGQAYTELKTLRLDNRPANATTRLEFAPNDASRTVEVPLTAEEQHLLNRYYEMVGRTNAINERVKAAKAREEHRTLGDTIRSYGKRMASRYPGTDAVTGEKFEAGTEICYHRGKCVIA